MVMLMMLMIIIIMWDRIPDMMNIGGLLHTCLLILGGCCHNGDYDFQYEHGQVYQALERSPFLGTMNKKLNFIHSKWLFEHSAK